MRSISPQTISGKSTKILEMIRFLEEIFQLTDYENHVQIDENLPCSLKKTVTEIGIFLFLPSEKSYDNEKSRITHHDSLGLRHCRQRARKENRVESQAPDLSGVSDESVGL